MTKIAILGASILGQHVAHYLKTFGAYELYGFYDDEYLRNAHNAQGIVRGRIENVEEDYQAQRFDALLMGIGYKHMKAREEIFETYVPTIPFLNLIHPTSYLDATVALGKGNIIFPGCILDKGVTLADNILLNIGCKLAHDVKVGAHCFFAPGVSCAGFVDIAPRCFLGINTTIIDGVRLSSDIQTGVATTVIKNLTQSGLYVGTPSRLIR